MKPSENVKQSLKGASATRRMFDLPSVDLSSHEGDVGTDFVVMDARVLNVLFKAKCGECGHNPETGETKKKEYDLAMSAPRAT